MKILVTGATGAIGCEVVKRLAGRVAVRASTQFSNRVDVLQHTNAEVVIVDYSAPAKIRAAFSGIDRMLLLTPVHPDMVARSNMLVDFAKQHHLQHVVRVSSLGTTSEFGRWHREADAYLERSGLPFTILEPNALMQNFVKHVDDVVRRREPLRLPLGDARISYVDARDVASVGAAVLSMDGGFKGKRLSLTGPEPLSAQAATSILSSAVGRNIRFINDTNEVAREALRASGTPEWLTDLLLDLYESYRNGAGDVVTDTIEYVIGKPAGTFAHYARDARQTFA